MADHKQKALNALAKGAGITAIGMAFSKVITYLYRIVVARFIGPNAYGQLSLGLMVYGIGGTIAVLALHKSLEKYIPEFRTRDELGKIKGVVLSSLYLIIPISLAVSAAIYFSSGFLAVEVFGNPALIPIFKIFSIGPLFSALGKIFFSTTVGYNKIFYKTVSTKIIQNIVQLVLTVILVLAGFQVAGAAWGMVIGTIVAAVLGLYFMEKKIGPVIFSDAKPVYQYRKIIRFSSPLLISGMIGTAMGWADTALLGYYMTDFEVGLYNAALPTAMLILLPHKAIGSLAVSSFSELKEKDRDSVEKSLQTATRWVFSLVFPTFLILMLFSDRVLQILWGGQYTRASLALSILAVGYLIDALVGRVGSYLNSTGYTDYILYNNIAALTLNLILNIVLIPIYGIIGAAVATAASTVLTNILMFAEVWRKEGVISIPHREVIKILITGLIPLSLVIGLGRILFADTPYWFLLPAGLIYGLVYTGLYLLMVGLGEEEKEVILRIGELTGQEKLAESLLNKL